MVTRAIKNRWTERKSYRKSQEIGAVEVSEEKVR